MSAPPLLAHHRSQQGVRELSTDRRARSAPPPWPGRAGRAAPSEMRAGLPGPPGWRRNRGGCLRAALALRLQHRFGHLLHEQGDAVGSFDDVLPDVRRKQLVADERAQSWRSISRSARRLMVRTVTYGVRSKAAQIQAGTSQSAARKGANPVHDPTEHFEARRVGPMRVLEDHQHRSLARQPSIWATSAFRFFCRRCAASRSSVG